MSLPKTYDSNSRPTGDLGASLDSSKPLRGGHHPSVSSSLSPVFPSRVTRSPEQRTAAVFPPSPMVGAVRRVLRGSLRPWLRSSYPNLVSVRYNSPLALKIQADLQLAGLDERTQESYLCSVRKFAQWLKRAPDQASENDLRRYLLFIKNDQQWEGIVLQAGGLIAISRWLSEATPPVPCVARPRNVRAVVRQRPQRATLHARNQEHQQRSTGGNDTRQALPRVVAPSSDRWEFRDRTSEDDAEESNPHQQPAYQSRRFHAVSAKRHPLSRH
ncbi:MAG: phage integrase N-terminal SAM-like domain-containing protein [Pirellulales bacterium]